MELQEGTVGKEVNRVEIRKEMKREPGDTRTCYCCGFIGHISRDPNCPAKGKKCRKCNQIGHFEKLCRKRRHESERDGAYKRPRYEKRSIPQSVNMVVVKPESVYDVFCTGSGGAHIECMIGGVNYMALIDSGSDLNIMGYCHWEELKKSEFKIWDPVAGSEGKVIKAYASSEELTIKGAFSTNVKVGEKTASARFYVVEKGNRVLLSRKTSTELGILKIGVNAVSITSKEFNKIKG